MAGPIPFTDMSDSTAEQWAAVAAERIIEHELVADRILLLLGELDLMTSSHNVNQLQHSLLTASLAEDAGASEEMIIAALLHDVGKAIQVGNHGPIAAEILQPYVSHDTYMVIRHHQDFARRYYATHFGGDPNVRDAFRDEPWFATAEVFVDEWDSRAFDADYPIRPLAHFEPMLRRLVASAPPPPTVAGPGI